jgi:hypothetical protein
LLAIGRVHRNRLIRLCDEGILTRINREESADPINEKFANPNPRIKISYIPTTLSQLKSSHDSGVSDIAATAVVISSESGANRRFACSESGASGGRSASYSLATPSPFGYWLNLAV